MLQNARSSTRLLTRSASPATKRTGAMVMGGCFQGLGIARSLGRHGVPRMQPRRQPVGAMTAASRRGAGDVAETARVTLQGSPPPPAS